MESSSIAVNAGGYIESNSLKLIQWQEKKFREVYWRMSWQSCTPLMHQSHVNHRITEQLQLEGFPRAACPGLDNQSENRLSLLFMNFQRVGTRLSVFNNSMEVVMKKGTPEQKSWKKTVGNRNEIHQLRVNPRKWYGLNKLSQKKKLSPPPPKRTAPEALCSAR